MRRWLPILLPWALGCATLARDPQIASADCRAGEWGWWSGPLTNCSWNPFMRRERQAGQSE